MQETITNEILKLIIFLKIEPSLFSFASGLCHQIPERSFHFSHFTLPFCARCTGVYWGVLSGFIGVCLAGGGKRSGLPVYTIRWVSLLLLILFPLEVLIEKFLPFSLPLFVRTYIGIGFGISFSIYLIPLFNYFFWYNKSESKPILDKFAVFILILFMSIGIFEFGRFSASVVAGYILGGLSVAGAIFIYIAINLTIISSIPLFRRFPRSYLIRIPLSLFLAMGEITLIKIW